MAGHKRLFISFLGDGVIEEPIRNGRTVSPVTGRPERGAEEQGEGPETYAF
jgi:hypothetical protein